MTEIENTLWQKTFMEKLFPVKASDLDIEGAFRLKAENVPLFMYKYRNCDEYSFQNLRDGTIWLGDPSTMNDPYDCAHHFDLKKLGYGISKGNSEGILGMLPTAVQNELLDLMNDIIDERQADLVEELSTNLKKSFKFCSFSERVDSPLMWAHYTDSHRGFCIEYAPGYWSPGDYRIRYLFPVQYANALFDATDCFVAKHEKTAARETKNNLRLTLAALFKATDWSYEREWRLVFSNGVMKSAGPYTMPKPTAIYLGSKISLEHEKILIEIAEAKQIILKKMHHSPTQFKMNAVVLGAANEKISAPKNHE